MEASSAYTFLHAVLLITCAIEASLQIGNVLCYPSYLTFHAKDGHKRRVDISLCHQVL